MNDITKEKIKEFRRPSMIMPEDFLLENIISILVLTISQRSAKQMMILREFTKSIKFFENLVKENGKFLHVAACERLCYEFVQAGKVIDK